VVQWPGGIQARGEVRNQFHHVIDVAPTVLEVARLPEPTILHGVTQEPMHGVSVAYSFDDANAADRHQTQHFEMMGNRGIYHKGWTAVTKHRTPWVIIGHGVAFDDDVWELYDIPIPAGDHQLRLEFAYDGGGLGKGGTASLFVDGEPAGTGRVDRTAGYLFSLDETSDVGADSCSPVCDDYPPGTANAFTGAIRFIRVDLGDDNHDQLIDPEIKAQLAPTRQ